MSIFNPPHFLRHIGMPTLQEFTQSHVLGAYLEIDWNQDVELLPALLNEAVETLAAELSTKAMTPEERKDVEAALGYWYDDLRRCHLMSNELAIRVFLTGSPDDSDMLEAFVDRDDREKALWMFTFRDKAFRDAELHLSFLAKTNGKYWKKHRIQAGLVPTNDRTRLEVFSQAVAALYKRVGGGQATHVEVSQRTGSTQITLYVEGPVTALAHFSQSHFTRITTRIAMETAVVYHPASGIVETVVKGGAKNHKAVLKLFGEHVVQVAIDAEEIEPKRYRLNALRDGLEPFEDWSSIGVKKVRMRRAAFTRASDAGCQYTVEATDAIDQADAIDKARSAYRVTHSFEAEYSLEGGTLSVYVDGKGARSHFSFNLFSSGSSTIKNLSAKNQRIAQAVLKALNVIEPDELPEAAGAEDEETAAAWPTS